MITTELESALAQLNASSMAVGRANELADDLRAQLTKAEADAEAHRLRCVSLETQLEMWKRRGLESDERAEEAGALLDDASDAINHDAFPVLIERIGNWRLATVKP